MLKALELTAEFLRPFSPLVFVHCGRIMRDESSWAVRGEVIRVVGRIVSTIGIGAEVHIYTAIGAPTHS